MTLVSYGISLVALFILLTWVLLGERYNVTVNIASSFFNVCFSKSSSLGWINMKMLLLWVLSHGNIQNSEFSTVIAGIVPSFLVYYSLFASYILIFAWLLDIFSGDIANFLICLKAVLIVSKYVNSVSLTYAGLLQARPLSSRGICPHPWECLMSQVQFPLCTVQTLLAHKTYDALKL